MWVLEVGENIIGYYEKGTLQLLIIKRTLIHKKHNVNN